VCDVRCCCWSVVGARHYCCLFCVHSHSLFFLLTHSLTLTLFPQTQTQRAVPIPYTQLTTPSLTLSLTHCTPTRGAITTPTTLHHYHTTPLHHYTTTLHIMSKSSMRENVKVVCRIRPETAQEVERQGTTCVSTCTPLHYYTTTLLHYSIAHYSTVHWNRLDWIG
jgi:hypothetical protein